MLSVIVLIGASLSILVSFGNVTGGRTDEAAGPGLLNDVAAGPSGRFGWNVLLEESFDFALNSTTDLRLEYDPVNVQLNRTGSLDPYLAHNSTVRTAIDRAPQWLNLTLSWRFHEIYPYYVNRYIDLLTNTTIDLRYLDELAFLIAFLPEYFINSYFLTEPLLLENVEMMYVVSSDVSYCDIVDVQKVDGQHSTVIYATPTGNITLPEEIYYWYLVMPRSELETPSFIDLSNFRKTIDPNGAFWRGFLYTANDTGYPVLKDLLSKQTTLWNGTKNQMEGNGAVGAVTFWANRCIMFRYEDGMRRDHQPVSLYKQHFGLCGENAEVLVAAAKTALIPAVVTITFEGMHAWNEFYERGWHQWQAYSGHIDDPLAEGAPGSVSVFTSFNGDMSQFSATPGYTTTTTLRVRVRDAQGMPVDGAMVRLTSQSMMNDPFIIPLIGNLTDVRGETTFVVGSGRAYFLQVLSPIGLFGNETDPLVLAFPFTPPGQTLEFNATLIQNMPLRVDLSKVPGPGSEIALRVTLEDIVQLTEAWTDPMNYGVDHWRSYPDRTSLTFYFLDQENLSLYRSGSQFVPAAVLTLSGNATGTVTLGPGREWTIMATGLSLPMTRTLARIMVEVLQPVPSARILSPLPGTYSTEETISFSGEVEPSGPYLQGMMYIWSTDQDPDPLSDSKIFQATLGEGEHNITFIAWNGTGIVSKAYVDILVVRPNHPPKAVISSPKNGSVFQQGEIVRFLSNGSYDPDQDMIEFLWSEEGGAEPLSYDQGFERAFTTGTHNVTLTVLDPFQLGSSATVTFSVVPLNNPPVPYIMSPKPWTAHTLGEPVQLSANGTFDLDGDPLNYSWSSSKDGPLSSSKEDMVLLSEGYHTITLSVSDGRYVRETAVSIDIVPLEPPRNRPPVAVISSPEDGDSYYVSDDISMTSEGTFDPDGTPITFNWTINKEPVSTMDALTLRLEAGIWTLALNVSDGELWGVDSVTIIVYDRSPIVVLKVNGTVWQESTEVRTFEKDQMVLDASGSYDPDGTELNFEWSINGTLLFSGPIWTRNFTADLYIIQVLIKDGGGRSASFTLQLRSLDKGSGPQPPDDGVGPEEKGLPALAIVAIGTILLSVVVIAILFVISRRMKRSEAVWED